MRADARPSSSARRAPGVRGRHAWVAAVVAMVAAACSGGSDASGTTEVPPTTAVGASLSPTVGSTQPPVERDPEALERARAVDLTLDDFPEGWTQVDDAGRDPREFQQECDERFADREVLLAEHATDAFLVGDPAAFRGARFVARTAVYVSEQDAIDALAPYDDIEDVACFGFTYDDALEQLGLDLRGQMLVDPYELTIAEEARGATGQFVVELPTGDGPELLVGLLASRTGDMVTTIEIQSLDGAITYDDIDQAIRKLESLQRSG